MAYLSSRGLRGWNIRFKQAAYRRIGLMRPEDARELIVEPIHGVIAVKDETIHAILRLTAGHPYFTQLICFETYNYLRSQNQRELSSVDTGLVDQAIETGHGALNWFWEGLPRAERFVLSAIAHVTDAQGVASKAAIQQILEKHRIILTGLELQDAPERLVEWEILSRKGADAYHFTVELVRHWMLKAHPLESARRDVNFISKRAVQLYEVAREAHMAGMLEYSRDDYRKALAANPNHSGAQLGLAQVLFELGEFEAAVEAFEKAYAIDEMSARDGLVRARIAVGQKHEEAGHQAEALVEYQKALQYTPQDDTLRRRLANIWLGRASEAIAAGGLANAYEAYREALSFDTDGGIATKLRLDFDTWVRQAESEQRHEDVVVAFNVLRRLLPDDTSAKDAEAEYYCRYGDNLVSAGHRAEAIRAYEHALELRPDDSMVVAKLDTVSMEWRKLLEIDNIFNDGFVAQQQGDWETAKSCWTQLIKMGVFEHQRLDIAKLLWDARQQVDNRPVNRVENNKLNIIVLMTVSLFAGAAIWSGIGGERLRQAEERARQAETRMSELQTLVGSATANPTGIASRIRELQQRAKDAEERSRQAEEGMRQAEERSRQAEERGCETAVKDEQKKKKKKSRQPAQELYNVGMKHMHGKGAEKDYARALRWLREAAKQGHSGAQAELKKWGIKKW
jgi:tetratricopeptide (TPR) repeat protein